ncbi:hypothetical protein AB0D42_38140 [Streptomyces sp. NPDC048304]|uniref:hypothetical protein n=1 Tax=Streptomyces sp. NPDC048304 TaxID=3154820 RepID=UPI0033D24267
MTPISHSVIVASVSRPRFEQALAVVHDVVSGTRSEDGRVLLPDGRPVPGMRLVKGEHLAPGAVYEADSEDGGHETQEQLRIVVRRSGSEPAARLEHVLGDEETVTVVEGALRSVGRPAAAELRGSLRTAGRWTALRQAHGEARVDFRAWWKAAAGRRFSGAPFDARLEHRFGTARLRAVPRPRDEGHWEIRLVVSLRGRSVMRPVAALGLQMFRRRLREAFADAVDRTAQVWNETVPNTLALDMDELRTHILDSAASPPEEAHL